jgi:hypothetical protein
MWGNLQGWLISVVLAGVILSPVAFLVKMSQAPAPAGPALDAANLLPMKLPAEPDEVWTLFTEDSDAGKLYKQTIAAWNDAAEAACAQFIASPTDQIPSPLQFLIDARHARRMTLFAADLPAVINYDSDHPDLEKLFAAGEWAYRAGLSLGQHGKQAQAEPLLEAAFALGRQLYQERIVFDECEKGMELMADAAAAECAVIPRGSELFDRLTDFQKALDDYQQQRTAPIWQAISSVDQQTIEQTAGDVLAFAEQSQERMWRVEATLKLGRYRFDAARLGDQIAAKRALRGLSRDADPAIAAAGQTGLNLTVETYRMIH